MVVREAAEQGRGSEEKKGGARGKNRRKKMSGDGKHMGVHETTKQGRKTDWVNRCIGGRVRERERNIGIVGNIVPPLEFVVTGFGISVFLPTMES